MPRGRSYESRAPGTRQRGRARSTPVPGFPPTARAARPSAQRRVPPLCRGDQGVDIGEEPLIIEAADRGVLEDAAGIRVDEGGQPPTRKRLERAPSRSRPTGWVQCRSAISFRTSESESRTSTARKFTRGE